MFEGIHASQIQGNPSNPAMGVSSGISGAVNRNVQPEKRNEEKAQNPVSQELLDGLGKDMESMHNVGLQFSVHDASGRTIVKVIDKETKELIREIPPEQVLDFAVKMQEMIGILFDKKV
jgi:flagellar protein FlaG